MTLKSHFITKSYDKIHNSVHKKQAGNAKTLQQKCASF
jgi:hypothetical protein